MKTYFLPHWLMTYPISVLGHGRYDPHIQLNETILMVVVSFGSDQYPCGTVDFRHHQDENLFSTSLADDLCNIGARTRTIRPPYPAQRDDSDGGSFVWLG